MRRVIIWPSLKERRLIVRILCSEVNGLIRKLIKVKKKVVFEPRLFGSKKKCKENLFYKRKKVFNCCLVGSKEKSSENLFYIFYYFIV